MIRNIILVILLTLLMLSTASAKGLSKGGGYTLCKKELKNAYPQKIVDTKLLKMKYRSRNKSRQGITHTINMRVSGVQDTPYKATCIVSRDEDQYSVEFIK